MANLQVKGIDDDLYAELKELAESENRSISQQVVYLLRAYLAKRELMDQTKNPAQVLLELGGSWKDERSARQIVRELREKRKNSRKLQKGF